MQSDGTVDSKELLTLFRDQVETLHRMKHLVQRQRMAVVQDDPEVLLDLLKQRQVVVDALVGLGSEMQRARRQWVCQRDSLAPPDRALGSRLIAEMSKFFEEIMEADTEDVRTLSAKKQLVGQALHTTHATAHAVSAYADHRPQTQCYSKLDEAS